MYYFTIKQNIESFEKWKPVFDSDEERRKSLGINTLAVMRNINNENEVTVIMTSPDEETIRLRSEDKIVKEKMIQAGVLGKPEWVIYKS